MNEQTTVDEQAKKLDIKSIQWSVLDPNRYETVPHDSRIIINRGRPRLPLMKVNPANNNEQSS